MVENLVKYFTKGIVDIDKFKFEKYWLRTFGVIEVYLICIKTSGRLYIHFLIIQTLDIKNKNEMLIRTPYSFLNRSINIIMDHYYNGHLMGS